jgi:hypothetical protein
MADLLRAIRVWALELRVYRLERARDQQMQIAAAYSENARTHRAAAAWYERRIDAANFAVRLANSE